MTEEGKRNKVEELLLKLLSGGTSEEEDTEIFSEISILSPDIEYFL